MDASGFLFVGFMTAKSASGRSDLAGWVSHPLVTRRLSKAHPKTGRWIYPCYGSIAL